MTTNEQWIDELEAKMEIDKWGNVGENGYYILKLVKEKLQEVDRQARIDELKRFDRSSEEMTKLIPLQIGERLYELTKQEEQK